MIRITPSHGVQPGSYATVSLIPLPIGSDIGITITTHTGTRLYNRPHYCPAVRRLCSIVGFAEIANRVEIRPALFCAGYTAHLRR